MNGSGPADIEYTDSYSRLETRGGGFYGHYGRIFSYHHGSGYDTSGKTFSLETNLYDVKTEKRIWSARSKMSDGSGRGKMVEEAMGLMVEDLLKNRLIAPK